MQVKKGNFFGQKSYMINPCHKVQQENKKELGEILKFFSTNNHDDFIIGYKWLKGIMNSDVYAKVNTLIYTLMSSNLNEFYLDEQNYWKIEKVHEYDNGIQHLHCEIYINNKQRVYVCADFPKLAVNIKIPHIIAQDELIKKTMLSTPVYPYGLINWQYIKKLDSKK